MGLSRGDWQRILRVCGMLVVIMAVVVIAADGLGTILGKAVVLSGGIGWIAGLVTSGIMYTVGKKPLDYMSVLMVSMAVGFGTAAGIAVIKLLETL